MKNVAVFYHSLISGGSRPINTPYAINLITEQMLTYDRSGLASQASAFYAGVNGGDDDAEVVKMLAPAKAIVIPHGKSATTEIPTLKLLQDWCRTHPDWYVLYFHTKGLSHPPFDTQWRRIMEHFCITGWRMCVFQLDSGADCCGCYWLTPEDWPGPIQSPFFGGTFWWAKSNYINTLPALPEPIWNNRYEAESWIGRAPVRPRVHCFTGKPSPWPSHEP